MAQNKQEHEGGGFAALFSLVFGLVAMFGGLYLLGSAIEGPEGLQGIIFVLGILVFAAAFFVPMTVIGVVRKK